MVEVTKLELARREAVGTNAVRGLRKAGSVPVVLYGHGREALALAAAGRALQDVIARGARFLELSIEGQTETALIREVQYDAFGLEVLHIDLMRVDIDEAINVSVPVEMRGRPKGLAEGGALQKLLTDVEIRIAPRHIPEAIVVNISGLEVNQSIYVRDLELPPSAKLLEDPDKIVCTVAVPRGLEEAAPAPAPEQAAEPEVVGQKKEAEEAPE
ncbi:MAG: 50S ribosomal protein L25 [Planctomycetes bacterium]|nr:50S ribosomal protein L25 [Planctomycetota bacterium]